MANEPRPLSYTEFLGRILMLDCFIPVIPSTPNTEFAIFRYKGSGYYPSGNGPICAFVSRDYDDPVPVPEILKCLKHLQIPESVFWEGVPDEKKS